MELTAPEPHLGLTVHILVCFALGVGLLAAGAVLRYRARGGSPLRNATYECGESPIGPAWAKFPVGFYLVALLFILFDVEAAFLFLWVQGLGPVGPAAFWAMVVFVAILLLGWIYAWRKGDLGWTR
jgi:NADH-quinone oxidoreductase subunit A